MRDADGDTDGYSNGYAYTDSYANGHSNGYAYADTYAYGYGPAETKPDTKGTTDTAASSVGAIRKRLCGNSRENLASSPRGEGGLMICTGRRACHAEA